MRVVLLWALGSWNVAWADCVTGDVVLNEMVPKVTGNAEWVELWANGGEDVDVSGWAVQYATRGTGSWSDAFVAPEGTIVRDGVPLVLAHDQAVLPPGIDVVIVPGAGLGNASTGSDGVRLVDCPGDVLDIVAYGDSNEADEEFLDESGVVIGEDRLAPEPSASKSMARIPDGADTDNGAVDFQEVVPTPGSANAGGSNPGGPCEAGVVGEVVINEFSANPDGTDGGFEWVELYNPGSDDVVLDGWSVDKATSTDEDSGDANWTAEVTFGEVTLDGGAYLLIAEEFVAIPQGVDAIVLDEGERLSLGNASSSSDAVRLADCAEASIDTVVYGTPNVDGFRDDRRTVASDDETAPAPASGHSLARRANGGDTEVAADDFTNEPEPTPGEANRDLLCRSNGGKVVINEFLPDVSGDEGSNEFVELFNADDVAIDVSTWQIGKSSSIGDDGPRETLLAALPAGSVIEPGAFLVVGGLFAEVADVVIEDFDLGSGTGGDLVWLRDCDGMRIDRVLYGGENDEGFADDDGFVPAEGAEDTSPDQCLARITDGLDTNTSKDDFQATTFCTPGATNTRDGGGGGPGPDPIGSVGCGCGGDPVIGDAPTVEPNDINGNGCATVPGGRMVPWLWLTLAVGTRRRRREGSR